MSQNPPRILVTGANGHLGRRLISHLAHSPSSIPVRALVRSATAAQMLERLPEAERPDVRIIDYTDAGALAAAAEKCRSAVHLVGVIKESSRARYVEAHERTCEALARAAESAGLERIVYLSILGAAPDSSNACLASKGRAEQILLDCGVPTTVLRVPMVIGEGDIAARALRGQALSPLLALVGGGRTLQQPIDGEDVIAAICAALERSQALDEALDLAGPECLSHRALIERAAALLGRTPRAVAIPLFLAKVAAALLERALSDPPITRAMLGVLQHDDQIDPAAACERLGITLRPLDQTLRRCVVGSEAS